MAPKNPKSARGKNNPPLIKHRAKRLEHQQLRKAIADLRRRRVQLEKKIDWKSEAEALRKLSHQMYSIQKESEGKIEKRLEEVLEAVKNITSSLIHLVSIL
ncbi:hypothetical protein K1719_042576 [Acacia pycnantha]|nr:hypothetical protein K1719_042576 [Acacia pycnantha]